GCLLRDRDLAAQGSDRDLDVDETCDFGGPSTRGVDDDAGRVPILRRDDRGDTIALSLDRVGRFVPAKDDAALLRRLDIAAQDLSRAKHAVARAPCPAHDARTRDVRVQLRDLRDVDDARIDSFVSLE